MNSFVNLSILECNRVNSEEAKTGNNENPAMWHNKLGTGITINPGDRIQVEQAFVNEVGAGDQIIEFNGKSLNANASITYLTRSDTNASDLIPAGYEKIEYTETTDSVPLYDNKASIVIGYQKAMNGENYIQMPRKFTCLESIINGSTTEIQRQIWNAQETSPHLGSNVSNTLSGGTYGSMGGLPWHQVPYFVRASRTFYYADCDYYYSPNTYQDQFNASNRANQDFFKLRNDGSSYTIFVNPVFYARSYPGKAIGADLSAVQLTLTSILGDFAIGSMIKVNGVLEENNFITAYNASSGVLTMKNNISVPTGAEIIAVDNASTEYAPIDYWATEPSRVQYLEYRERLDLEIGIGRNSPSNVAEDITNQLRRTGEFKKIYYDRTLHEPNFTPSKAISGYIESNTYKIFNAMNAYDMNNLNYEQWNASSFNVLPPQSVVDWLGALQFIGVKRPDLYNIGKGFNAKLTGDTNQGSGSGQQAYVRGTISIDDNGGLGPDYIPTSIFYNEENLLNLKELFEAQANYPELFYAPYNDYGNGAQHWSGSGTRGIISVDTNRYLHINPYRNRVNGADISGFGALGTDDINGSGASINYGESNYISLPLFFYYDTNASQSGSNVNNGENASTLTYGFAGRYTPAGTSQEYIRLYVGDIGGFQPPLEYFNRNASAGSHDGANPNGSTISSNTLLGWDEHWTAYGTCVVALCDGYVDKPYLGNSSSNVSNLSPDYENLWINGVNSVWSTGGNVSPAPYTEQIKKVYLGANEPLFNFDNVTGRFNISQLHTPEYIGNDYRAGSTPSGSETISIPINPDADKKVYKINKRIGNNNWTTAMLPFTANYVLSASGATEYNLALMNPNFDQYSIIDSKSAIFIKDFGVNETNWQDSMWGILGFTYNQFNSNLTANNAFNKRISEQNVKALGFATTNADITSGQSIEYITNEWGVPVYNQQVPGVVAWYGADNNASDVNVSFGTRPNFLIQNYPPITEEQNSIKLVASNQPKKMIQPYFCIRSDLVDRSHYLGGQDSGQALPVVAVINKINGYGDYYFSSGENILEFTATERRTITSITTSIHYPDQTYAECDLNSAVIYKIERNQPAVSNILEEIMEQTKKK